MTEVREAFERAWDEFMKEVEVGTVRSLYIKDRHGYRYDFDREEDDDVNSVTCGSMTSCCEGFKIRVDDLMVDIDLLNNGKVYSFVLIPMESIDKIWTHVGGFEEGLLWVKDQTLHYERNDDE